MALRLRSGRGLRRPARDVGDGDVWLGHDPGQARIGATGWTTSLFPKHGRYLVPVKASVRKAEGLELGDLVRVRLAVDV